MFLRVERNLVLYNFVLYFSACGICSGIVKICGTPLWCCVIFSACGTRFGIVELRVIFSRIWILCRFVLYFSTCGMRSGSVEFWVIFFCVCNFSGIVELCVIFFCLPVEHALVLWNLVLYALCVWNVLWYCGIFQTVFFSVASISPKDFTFY